MTDQQPPSFEKRPQGPPPQAGPQYGAPYGAAQGHGFAPQYGPPPGYGQYPPAPYGYAGQPPAYAPGKPSTNIGWAIGAIFGFWPLAIPSFIFALRVDDLWARGDYAGSHKASHDARLYGLIAVIIGVVIYVVTFLIILFAVVFVTQGVTHLQEPVIPSFGPS